MVLDHRGNPISSREKAKEEVNSLRRQIHGLMRAKYDAAATHIGNENHWVRADHLDPHSANSLAVRRKLRSRSRYEVIENNCYLKGIILMFANDFVGRGLRLQITDSRLSKERRRFIEQKYNHRARLIRLRNKLWQWSVYKKVDGEACGVAFDNPRLKHPVKLDWFIIETDQMSHPYGGQTASGQGRKEVDGIQFDNYFQPLRYSILKQHPGSNFLFDLMGKIENIWVREKYVVHWFRRDRAWLRGIPETTPSLPLCAILRRYTLAVLKAAEFAANASGVLQTDGPVGGSFWTDLENLGAATGGDIFPTESGMFVTLPWGYKLGQIESKQPMEVYDVFVNALLREIARPLLIPYNRAAGSSQDSNMASAVVDEQVYKTSVWNERWDCEDEVLAKDVSLWWEEGIKTEGYFNEPIPINGTVIDDFSPLLLTSSLRSEPPQYAFRWDQVGIEHTDPQKVSAALASDWERGFRTDQEIQEELFNRPYEDWVSEMEESLNTRRELGLPVPSQSNEYREEISLTPDDPDSEPSRPSASRNGRPKSRR